MKRILTLFLLSFLLLLTISGFSQKLHKITKSEKKAAKELVREYYSTDFGLCQYWKRKNAAQDSENQITSLNTETQKYNDEIDALRREGKKEIDSLQRMLDAEPIVKSEVKKFDVCTLTTGIVYKIQATIPDSDWEKTQVGNNETLFTGDEETENTKIYTFACFIDKKEAEDFNQKLLDLKLDTQIEVYEDGKKIK